MARTPTELAAESADQLTFTLGNFDGLHLGHRAVIAELVGSSRARGGTSVAVTFDPHPLSVIHPDRAPRLLTPLAEKLDAMVDTGIDVALVVDFTSELASENAGTFLSWLGVVRGAHLVLGYDFQMGRGRACDLSALSVMGAELGYGLDVVPPVEHDGLPISSSRIRESLGRGDVQDAAAMLGRPYSIGGSVVEGSGIGRGLGSPTANLLLPTEKLLPGDGVYFVTTESVGGRPGLMYVGTRPTLDGGARVAEVHVLDFEGDLYGQELHVGLLRRLRGDSHFGSRQELRQRIKGDVKRARAMAEGHGGV
ncbi:MAG: riboflavin biosynthesis protein RibF [Candidatus Eisenbacteria sp.]|nr:riboflavin biosynthesis protein RibF [Candidatus Eisenbacteria bacterium]